MIGGIHEGARLAVRHGIVVPSLLADSLVVDDREEDVLAEASAHASASAEDDLTEEIEVPMALIGGGRT